MIYLLLSFLSVIVLLQAVYFRKKIKQLEELNSVQVKRETTGAIVEQSTRSMFSILYGNK